MTSTAHHLAAVAALPCAQPDDLQHMTTLLDALSADEDRYLDAWLEFAEAHEVDPQLRVTAAGNPDFRWGINAGQGELDRVRVASFLSAHLRTADQQAALIKRFLREYRYIDDQPNRPHETTEVVREFLITGGVLLLDPRGVVKERGAYIENWRKDHPMAAASVSAVQGLWILLRRPDATRHIARIIRLCGQREGNGWTVLKGKGL